MKDFNLTECVCKLNFSDIFIVNEIYVCKKQVNGLKVYSDNGNHSNKYHCFSFSEFYDFFYDISYMRNEKLKKIKELNI